MRGPATNTSWSTGWTISLPSICIWDNAQPMAPGVRSIPKTYQLKPLQVPYYGKSNGLPGKSWWITNNIIILYINNYIYMITIVNCMICFMIVPGLIGYIICLPAKSSLPTIQPSDLGTSHLSIWRCLTYRDCFLRGMIEEWLRWHQSPWWNPQCSPFATKHLQWLTEYIWISAIYQPYISHISVISYLYHIYIIFISPLHCWPNVMTICHPHLLLVGQKQPLHRFGTQLAAIDQVLVDPPRMGGSEKLWSAKYLGIS